jgi:hypothetical protein
MAIEADIWIPSISPTICCHVNMTAEAEENLSPTSSIAPSTLQYCVLEDSTMYKKIHLQEESVCKQVISDYHAGKVHLELLQGKRACTLCVFNAQVSRIISTSVLQQHLHPTIAWK